MSEDGRDTGGGRDRDKAAEEDEKEDEKKGRDRGKSHNLHTDGVESSKKKTEKNTKKKLEKITSNKASPSKNTAKHGKAEQSKS